MNNIKNLIIIISSSHIIISRPPVVVTRTTQDGTQTNFQTQRTTPDVYGKEKKRRKNSIRFVTGDTAAVVYNVIVLVFDAHYIT